MFVFEIAPRATAATLGVARRKGVTLSKARSDRIWGALDDEIIELAYGGNSDWLWWQHQNVFIDAGFFNTETAHVWKAMIEPGPLAADIVALAGEVDSVIGSILARTP